jgi:vitamin B12 transporter
MFTVFLFCIFSSLSFANSNNDSDDGSAQRLEPILIQEQKGSSEGIDSPTNRSEVSGERFDSSGTNVEHSLSKIPGLSFSTSGGKGQSRSIFIRGARAEDTLVIFDGIPMNDPLSPSRSFDFSQMPTSLESIEILKGSQSVLYGSDAIGGVILLKSKSSTLPNAKVEAGSHGSFRARGSQLGFHAGYERSDGISSADENQGNTERDGYRSYYFGGKKDFALGEKGVVEAQGYFQHNFVETDRDGGPGGDSLGTQAKSTNVVFRLGEFHDLGSGWTLNSAASLFSKNRDDNTAGPSFYRSNIWKIESLAKRTFENHAPSFGADFSKEMGRSSDFTDRKSFQSFASFLQWDWQKKSFHGSHGGRVDFHSEHKRALTYRTALGYWISPEVLRLKTSIGSGFKAPSLYQTFSLYGSRNLQPTKSISRDLSLEWLGEDWQTELGAFQNHYREYIDFQSTPAPGRYLNIGKAETAGLEFSHRHQLGFFFLDTALTWMNARDRSNGNKLRRRPNLSGFGEFGFRKGDFAGAALQMRWVGKREDTLPIFPYSAQSMPSFAVFGAEIFHRVKTDWKFSLRVENILNRAYQETSGFGTLDRSFYLSVEWQ